MSYKKTNKKTGLRYPAINDLVAKADNKYELVLATAKRAREIVDGNDPLVIIDVNNPVSIATKEIDEDVVRIVSFADQPLEENDDFPEEVMADGPSTMDIAESLTDTSEPEEALCEDNPEAVEADLLDDAEEVEEVEETEEA